MRALLDVNILVALLDPEHSFHERAHTAWIDIDSSGGWASCPITENGVLRILSNDRYPGASGFDRSTIFANLIQLMRNSDHSFWPDDISLLDRDRFDPTGIFSHKQLTDIYLLGLAVHNKGRFVTFDRRVPMGALHESAHSHIWVI